MTKINKVAFVTPRYGNEVLGGAEFGAKMMAENLVKLGGISVEVLTTTSLDTETWANHYSPGPEIINDVVVHRFFVEKGRSKDFPNLSGRLLKYPKSATLEESERWIDAQGPQSSLLLERIKASDADVIFFFPYLYHPIVRAIPYVAGRAVLIPAAHDEPPAYLPVYKEVFKCAKALIFQSKAEETFTDSTYLVAHKPRLLSGLGIERYPKPIPYIGELLPALRDQPYLLTLGRVDPLKGATLLSELFAEYKRRNPSPLKLVFAGPVTTPPVDFPDILNLGPVSEQLKWSLISNCTALVNPSPFESFSIVLFEAWSLNRPVLVNSDCHVTRDHVRNSGGGLAFGTFAEFETEINLIYSRPELRELLGLQGKNYLEANYKWEILIHKLKTFLEQVF